MKKTIDARKKVCPEPVILTKQQLDDSSVSSTETIVDNKVAKENLSKLATGLNYKYDVKELAGDYKVTIYKSESADKDLPDEKSDLKELTIGISSNLMGKGDDELGHILMKSYIYTVSQTKPYPDTIVFYNSGVKLTSKGSDVLEDLKILDEAGVDIISCGTCLNFYGLEEDLQIGTVSNMYEIYEKLNRQNIII